MKHVKEILQANAFQITIVLVGVGITLVNLYISSLLAPLSTRIDQVTQKAEAIEEQIVEKETLSERFFVVEERTRKIHEEVVEIQRDIKTILQLSR